MKKYILTIATLLTVTLPFMGAGVARAQVVNAFTPDQQAQIDTLKAEITSLIYQLIAVLQAEIQELQLAEQRQNPPVGGGNTSVTPPQSQPEPVIAPSPSVVANAQTCNAGQAVVRLNVVNTIPNTIAIHTTGNGIDQRAQSNGRFIDVDWLPTGTFDYTLKAWSGNTAPFTEGTWQDTRPVLIDTTGTITIAPCL